MSDESITDPIASLAQFGAALVNMASVLGDYYKALINSGIPDVLAVQIVNEFHVEWVRKITGR